MSADNGIYVLRTRRTALENPSGVWTNGIPNYVWRVAHTNAIDNLDYYTKEEPHNLGAYLFDVFGRSPVYVDENIAALEAYAMSKTCAVLEHGISTIELDLIFYGDH